MRVKGVKLDKHGRPDTLTVKMTAREAALIVRMIGPTTFSEREAIQSDGGEVGSRIFDALGGDLFNLFYEDGIDGVSR